MCLFSDFLQPETFPRLFACDSSIPVYSQPVSWLTFSAHLTHHLSFLYSFWNSVICIPLPRIPFTLMSLWLSSLVLTCVCTNVNYLERQLQNSIPPSWLFVLTASSLCLCVCLSLSLSLSAFHPTWTVKPLLHALTASAQTHKSTEPEPIHRAPWNRTKCSSSFPWTVSVRYFITPRQE